MKWILFTICIIAFFQIFFLIQNEPIKWEDYPMTKRLNREYPEGKLTAYYTKVNPVSLWRNVSCYVFKEGVRILVPDYCQNFNTQFSREIKKLLESKK